MIIQIYEIQSPKEAEVMIRLGVDHIGSVIVDPQTCQNPQIKATVQTVQAAGAKSTLIPLFDDVETIFRILDFYQPNIVHLCDILPMEMEDEIMSAIIDKQIDIKKRYPEMDIMRSIPILPPNSDSSIATLEWACCLMPFTDWFLTDTLLIESNRNTLPQNQPVAGYVGITGCQCDWMIARTLVQQSRIPVILAGGLGPKNVGDGVLAVQPSGVDSCTLTNAIDSNGKPIRFKKDMKKVAEFVVAARKAEGQPLSV